MRSLCVFLLALPAAAGTLLFSTPPGSVNPFDGQPVAARALFSTSPGAVAVTLENLMANPTAVTQNVSGLMFMLGGISPDEVSLAGSEGEWIRVAKNGTFSSLGTASAGWLPVPGSGGLELCGFCGAAWPGGTLIGPPDGLYDAANGSIAGSRSHNPFLFGPFEFQMAAPSVTSATGVQNVVFAFGTTPGANVAAESPVPEPASAVPAALGSLALLRLLSSKYARQMGADLHLRGVARHRGGSRLHAAAEPEDARDAPAPGGDPGPRH